MTPPSQTRSGARLAVPAALAVLIVVCAVAPFGWQVLTSLKPAAELSVLPPILPSHPTIASYSAVFEGRPFARIILNSAIVASLTTIICLLIGAPAAFALAKLGFRGKGAVLGGVLAVSMFPPIATVSPLFLVISRLGLRDSYAALVIPYVTFSLPLAIWILTSFFRDIPDDLVKAARVDGCTHFQAFTRVVVPLSAPGVATTAILVFIFAWNEFLYALTFTATEKSRTIPVGIALFPGLHQQPWGEIAAASVIVTVPVVLLVLAFQGRIVAGLTAGSVKG